MYPLRAIKKLNVDSDEQQRAKNEKMKLKNNIISAKQQFKRRQITDDSTSMEKNTIQHMKKRENDMDLSYLFKADSNQDYKFQQTENKLQKLYPQFLRPLEASREKKQAVLTMNTNNDKKKKVIKNQDPLQKTIIKEKSIRKSPLIKNQENNELRQKILRDFAVRWWYSYPQWPPKDFDYDKELLNRGYRLVQENQFRFQENIVKGLLKAAPIKGFPGFFKAKNKLLDLRPKNDCPSIQMFRQKTTQQLLQLVKLALKNQIKILSQKRYRAQDENNLRIELKKLLEQYSLF